MGRAAQAKKAKRIARERGEEPGRSKRRLGYPLIVAAAVLLGVLVVWYARRPADTPSANLVTPEVQTTDSTITAASSTSVPTSTTAAQ